MMEKEPNTENHPIRSSDGNGAGPAPGPMLRRIVRLVMERYQGERCLLAVCPNSEAVARAAMEAAKEAGAPLIYAATLNQIDRDGGYTGWTPESFADFAKAYADEIEYDGPLAICLDHGGPWLKDQHRRESLTFEESMRSVKQSLEACIDAGYAMLHIDPTVDPTLSDGSQIPIEVVVERTLELMGHAESYREQSGRAPICYEVGTEEVHGGLADENVFTSFLRLLDAGLKERGLTHAWPCFVVGKVGTDLDTDYFDPQVAKRLTGLVRPFGAVIKGHYTDNVNNPEDYPLSGMGGANVGPEFTESEYAALQDLLALELKIGADSGLADALRRSVLESGRWKKWLHDDEIGREFDELLPGRQKWLIGTGSRYVWTAPAVIEARGRLYQNLENVRDCDAYVRWRIRTAVLKYYHAFNLLGFSRCTEQLMDQSSRSGIL